MAWAWWVPNRTASLPCVLGRCGAAHMYMRPWANVRVRLLGWLVRYVYEKRGRYSFPRGATLRSSNSSLALRPRWSAALRSSSGSMVRQAAAAHPIVEVVVWQGGGGGNLLEAKPPEEAGAVLLNVKLQLQASKQQRNKARNEASETKERPACYNRREAWGGGGGGGGGWAGGEEKGVPAPVCAVPSRGGAPPPKQPQTH
eukprot:COSAG06_NODE_7845_length_2354_cov_124.351220_1_plen_199_part_10